MRSRSSQLYAGKNSSDSQSTIVMYGWCMWCRACRAKVAFFWTPALLCEGCIQNLERANGPPAAFFLGLLDPDSHKRGACGRSDELQLLDVAVRCPRQLRRLTARYSPDGTHVMRNRHGERRHGRYEGTVPFHWRLRFWKALHSPLSAPLTSRLNTQQRLLPNVSCMIKQEAVQVLKYGGWRERHNLKSLHAHGKHASSNSATYSQNLVDWLNLFHISWGKSITLHSQNVFKVRGLRSACNVDCS